MTCEQCIHFDICNEQADGNIVELMKEPCFRFKDKDRLVEVVRYKDCKHHNAFNSCFYHSADDGGTPIFVRDNDFCSYGERKTE